ncbi:hypothetical protein NDI40_23185 [Microcoleus vaginatus ZQ-A3]|uniref:hypothetical protein n=1 Tax=Microcoleus vaginatus TaxID=119532 RepID=UPI001682530D|nr:hypothetical protein [Microcoleus sp. FACHB-84]
MPLIWTVMDAPSFWSPGRSLVNVFLRSRSLIYPNSCPSPLFFGDSIRWKIED